ncbi:MAG: LLM class flavin-dependent oxidoreductase [Nitriliruptorales bacterium]|nr:LLM class flavin-dependent oxidoreductase [Nitriliruptorales bacterium]
MTLELSRRPCPHVWWLHSLAVAPHRCPSGEGAHALPDLGVALLTFADARLDEIVDLGRTADELGYDACYTTESLTDALAIDLAIALATRTIRVASFVSISYLRHPLIAAQAAVTISDLSGGRFVLGLGLGHRPRVEAVGVDVGRPLQDLPRYITDVKEILGGRIHDRYPDLPVQTYQGKRLDVRTPRHPLPVYAAAVGPKMAAAGATCADGLMVYLVPRTGIAALADAVAKGAAEAGRSAHVPIDFALHAFVDDDLAAARDSARRSLTYWVGLPAYNAALARAGFVDEAARAREAFLEGDQDALRATISDRLIDEYCLVGPPERCREQLAAWQSTGVATVAVMPDPVSPDEPYSDAVKRTLAALAPR